MRTILALLSGLVLVASSAWADSSAPAGVTKKYHNNLHFRLPFQLGDADRANLREVHLYVKQGADTWVCVEKALPTQKSFNFKAPQDGEYWFSIATVDQSGKATPADVSREPPCLIVVVDTQTPMIEASLVPETAGGVVVHCEVKDANPDPAKLKVEYQTSEMAWLPLQGVANVPELFSIQDDKAWNGKVRATAVDKAGNVAMREFNFKGADPVTSADPDRAIPPAYDVRSTDPSPKGSQPTAVTKRVEKPARTTEQATGMANCQLINSTHAELAFEIDQVGPSGVGRVEVWATHDEGKNWKKLCEDKKGKSPVEFDLPGDGVYGLSLVVTNGNGMGDPPPSKGDAPDTWIEVDTTKPTAQLLHVRPALGDHSGALHITWSARDKNLGNDCVSLFYALQREGPWLPIAKGLKNDGSHRWSVPKNGGAEFFVRLEVTDRAGNVAVCESPEKIVFDTSRPKAKVIGITAANPHATAPTGN